MGSLTDENIIETANWYGTPHYARYPLVLDSGRGCWLFNEASGERFLDMLAGYSAVIFGRSGEYYNRLLEVLNKQARRLTLVSGNFYTEPHANFCEKITRFCSMDRVVVMNSGAEAVEAAMKIAKIYAYLNRGIPEGAAELIGCNGSFHGRTQGALSLMTEPLYCDHFGPLLPGCKHVPFGDAEALEWAITKNTAAFIVEPIQGEGGINIPPEGYLKKAEEICRQRGALLVLDEIQTGFGRTGPMFACQACGVKPDLLIVGKALGGGILPISAVLGRESVMLALGPGTHGSTFGGNPLACAVACEVLDILAEDPYFIPIARDVGDYFMSELGKIKSKNIKEVRGRGLLVGVELNRSSRGAGYCRDKLIENGIICATAHDHVVRFSPPLTITKEEIDWAMPRIRKVLEADE